MQGGCIEGDGSVRSVCGGCQGGEKHLKAARSCLLMGSYPYSLVHLKRELNPT